MKGAICSYGDGCSAPAVVRLDKRPLCIAHAQRVAVARAARGAGDHPAQKATEACEWCAHNRRLCREAQSVAQEALALLEAQGNAPLPAGVDHILVALGEASVCWDPPPSGVFQPERAKAIGARLRAELNAHLVPAPGEVEPGNDECSRAARVAGEAAPAKVEPDTRTCGCIGAEVCTSCGVLVRREQGNARLAKKADMADAAFRAENEVGKELRAENARLREMVLALLCKMGEAARSKPRVAADGGIEPGSIIFIVGHPDVTVPNALWERLAGQDWGDLTDAACDLLKGNQQTQTNAPRPELLRAIVDSIYDVVCPACVKRVRIVRGNIRNHRIKDVTNLRFDAALVPCKAGGRPLVEAMAEAMAEVASDNDANCKPGAASGEGSK